MNQAPSLSKLKWGMSFSRCLGGREVSGKSLPAGVEKGLPKRVAFSGTRATPLEKVTKQHEWLARFLSHVQRA